MSFSLMSAMSGSPSLAHISATPARPCSPWGRSSWKLTFTPASDPESSVSSDSALAALVA
jgi:hypothetical protein